MTNHTIDSGVTMQKIEDYHFGDTNLQDKRSPVVLQMRLEGKTLEEIAVFIGVTRERIRQIEVKAVERVNNPEVFKNIVAKPKKEITLMKTRIEDIGLSLRTSNALSFCNVRTVGGLIRKTRDDILYMDGMGVKGLEIIVNALQILGLELKKPTIGY